jgi:hypothetical protein
VPCDPSRRLLIAWLNLLILCVEWSGVECTYFACPLPVKDSNSRCWVPTRPRTKSWHFAHFSTGHSSFESSTVTHILVKGPVSVEKIFGAIAWLPLFWLSTMNLRKTNWGRCPYFHSICCTVAPIMMKKMQLCHQSRCNDLLKTRAMVQSWKKGVNS